MLDANGVVLPSAVSAATPITEIRAGLALFLRFPSGAIAPFLFSLCVGANLEWAKHHIVDCTVAVAAEEAQPLQRLTAPPTFAIDTRPVHQVVDVFALLPAGLTFPFGAANDLEAGSFPLRIARRPVAHVIPSPQRAEAAARPHSVTRVEEAGL